MNDDYNYRSSCCLSQIEYVKNWYGCFNTICIRCNKEPMEIYDITKPYNKVAIKIIRKRIRESSDGRWM